MGFVFQVYGVDNAMLWYFRFIDKTRGCRYCTASSIKVDYKVMALRCFQQPEVPHGACISLIGMAGVGKSTVGELLAKALDWAYLDTDRLLECYYGRPLQQIFDTLGRETFLQAEEIIVAGLGSKRCVISTGGSVVYGAKAMAKLRTLGPVVFLSATLKTVRGRLDNIQDRGLAIAPGQSIDSLYHERIPLYESAAHLVLDTDDSTPQESCDAILEWWRNEQETLELPDENKE